MLLSMTLCTIGAMVHSTTLVQIYDGSKEYQNAILCTTKRLHLPAAILVEKHMQTSWARKNNITVFVRSIDHVPKRYKKWALKLMLWSLPLQSVLFLDTDVFIFDKLDWLISLHKRNPDLVIMTPERASGFSVNTGLMIFEPSMAVHASIMNNLVAPLLLPANSDQEILTTFFGKQNKILQLGPMWGVRLQVNAQGQITGGSWNAHQWRQIQNHKEFFPYAIHYGNPKPWQNVSHNPAQFKIMSKFVSPWCDF